MKRILLLLPVLFVLGCSDSTKTEKIVKDLITKYMDKNLKDPSSYEIVELGKLDSVFYTKNGIYYVKDDLLNTYQFSHTNTNFKDDIGDMYRKELEDAEFVGFALTHKYKAKNSYGSYNTSDIQFYLSADLDRLWDEEIHLPYYFDKLPKKWSFTADQKNEIMSLINSDKDEYKDLTWYNSKKKNKYNIGKNAISMYAGLINDRAVLRLQIYYADSDWLFFDKVQMLYNEGEVLQVYFEKSDKETEVLSGGKIAEWIDVSIQSYVMVEKLEKVAQSETAKIKLTGSKYYDERAITPQEKAIIQEVINCYKVLESEN